MDKQSLMKGTLILGSAGILAKFLGIFFRWPLIMLVGDEGLGYYQMAYPLFIFFIGVASGIPIAVSKLVSESLANKDVQGAFIVLKKALLLMVILGGGFSFIFIGFSQQIISLLKWDPRAIYALVGISFAPIVIGLMSAFRGFFQGFQNMTPTAISEILEQFARVIVGVGLAYILLSKGIEVSVGGAAFGASAGGLLGVTYLYIKYKKTKKEMMVFKLRKDNKLLSKLLSISVPISVGAMVGSLIGLTDSILVPQLLLSAGFSQREATIMLGQLSGKAGVIIHVPLTLSIALCSSIVPIISSEHYFKRREQVLTKVENSISLSMVIALPSFLGLFFMAGPILNLLFPGHGEGSLILKFMSVVIPFMILTQTTTAILQGTGHYIFPVINLVLGCVLKFIITIILVPMPIFNVYGAIIGTIVAYVFVTVLNVFYLCRKLKITISFYNAFLRPAFAAVFMIIPVIYIHYKLYTIYKSEIMASLISIILGAIIYGVLIFIFGVFKYSYFKEKIIKNKRG